MKPKDIIGMFTNMGSTGVNAAAAATPPPASSSSSFFPAAAARPPAAGSSSTNTGSGSSSSQAMPPPQPPTPATAPAAVPPLAVPPPPPPPPQLAVVDAPGSSGSIATLQQTTPNAPPPIGEREPRRLPALPSDFQSTRLAAMFEHNKLGTVPKALMPVLLAEALRVSEQASFARLHEFWEPRGHALKVLSLTPPVADPTANLEQLPRAADYLYSAPGQSIELLTFDPREDGCSALPCAKCQRCATSGTRTRPPHCAS